MHVHEVKFCISATEPVGTFGVLAALIGRIAHVGQGHENCEYSDVQLFFYNPFTCTCLVTLACQHSGPLRLPDTSPSLGFRPYSRPRSARRDHSFDMSHRAWINSAFSSRCLYFWPHLLWWGVGGCTGALSGRQVWSDKCARTGHRVVPTPPQWRLSSGRYAKGRTRLNGFSTITSWVLNNVYFVEGSSRVSSELLSTYLVHSKSASL